MDINGSSRLRHRKTPSSDRFLAAYPRTTSQHPSSAAVNSANTQDNELSEDDIFSTGDFFEPSNNHRHSPPSSNSSPRHHHKPAFPQPESFGILAALPDHKINFHHHLYQKTAITSSPSSSTSSSSTTSSSRFIPSIPKPPQERLPTMNAGSYSGKFHQPQSAPVNVPVMAAMAMRHKEFDEIDEEEGGDGEMLPPHEMVARAQSPMVSCSVLEGVGRTLKGRDLRQVRNAVWRRTGFLD